MKPKSITPPAGSYYITITDYYLRITDGNATAAALLKLYESRHNQILYDLAKCGKGNVTFADLQQQSSVAFLRKCLLDTATENTIKKANDLLAEREFIQIFRNFAGGEKLPNTVVFMVENVQKAIDLGCANLSKGTSKLRKGLVKIAQGGCANLSKGLVKIAQGGCANLPIELSNQESILNQESLKYRERDENLLILNGKEGEVTTLNNPKNQGKKNGAGGGDILKSDIIDYFLKMGWSAELAEEYYDTYNATKWTYNGEAIANWRAFAKGFINKQPSQQTYCGTEPPKDFF